MQYRIFPVILLFFMAGCARKKTELPKKEIIPLNGVEGSWLLSALTSAEKNGDPDNDASIMNSAADKALETGSMISFFPDGNYTEINKAGTYNIGKWRYANLRKNLILTKDGHSKTVSVTHEAFNATQVMNIHAESSAINSSYILYGTALTDAKEDPFSEHNNRWRIAPRHAENDAQLQDRLANYFQHLICILSSSQKRTQAMISFAYSAGIVKIYGGGIGTAEKSSVPASWKAAFFSNSDAFRAYDMYAAYMLRPGFHGKSNGNWVTDDLMILRNIIADLEAGKFMLPKS